MKKRNIILSVALVSIVASSILSDVLADVAFTTTCPKPDKWTNEELKIEGAPSWKELVDKRVPWGINLQKVIMRSQMGTKQYGRNKIGNDPAITIFNLTTLIGKLKFMKELKLEYKAKEDLLDKELSALTSKKFKKEKDNNRISSIKTEKEQIKKEIDDKLDEKKLIASYKNLEIIEKKGIPELRGKVLADLGKYGLTCQEISLLPGLDG